jgi:hypothetical protein
MSELVSLCNIFSGRNDKMKKGDDEGCRDEDGSGTTRVVSVHTSQKVSHSSIRLPIQTDKRLWLTDGWRNADRF